MDIELQVFAGAKFDPPLVFSTLYQWPKMARTARHPKLFLAEGSREAGDAEREVRNPTIRR